jgi:hypothetical protein
LVVINYRFRIVLYLVRKIPLLSSPNISVFDYFLCYSIVWVAECIGIGIAYFNLNSIFKLPIKPNSEQLEGACPALLVGSPLFQKMEQAGKTTPAYTKRFGEGRGPKFLG